MERFDEGLLESGPAPRDFVRGRGETGQKYLVDGGLVLGGRAELMKELTRGRRLRVWKRKDKPARREKDLQASSADLTSPILHLH